MPRTAKDKPAESSAHKGKSKAAAERTRKHIPQACDVCRASSLGVVLRQRRGRQCTWLKGTVRKPRTEAHFEALRKQVDSLQAYCRALEERVAICSCRTKSESDSLSRPLASFDEEDEENDFGDQQADGAWEGARGEDVEEEELDDIAQELCIPAQDLKLGERELESHGITAPFRFLADSIDNPPAPPKSSQLSEKNAISHAADTYVFTLDGSNEFDPTFQWARYLPKEVPLSRQEHDRILDLLFKFFTMWCMRVVPSLFLRDMHRHLSVPGSSPPPKTTHYSPMLHNALIALASGFSDDPRIRDLRARQYFADAAKRCIEAECMKPNISVVHALSILASFHSTQGDQMLGYLYFGMSARISQALGLCMDAQPWVKAGRITAADMQDRGWAYWTTFTQDVCWSLYVGREFSLPAPSETVPVPFVDTASDQIAWSYSNSGLDPQANYLSSTFSATCDLLLIARKIMKIVNRLAKVSGRRDLINDHMISEIDVKIHAWKSRLKPEVEINASNRDFATPHKLMLHCMYWWSFILLHRPFFHRKAKPMHGSDPEVDHVKLCKRAAENLMDLVQSYRSLYSLRYVPMTMIQVVFSAGTVYLLLAARSLSGARIGHTTLTASLAQTDLCIDYLHEIAKSWSCATAIANILHGLKADRIGLLLRRRGMDITQQPLDEPAPAVPAAAAEAMDFNIFSALDSGTNYDSEMWNLLGMVGGETLSAVPFVPFDMGYQDVESPALRDDEAGARDMNMDMDALWKELWP
ncbi:unnamed protein product [Mycena citricolor]|uniref:Xylanolytic transcriptional activator regulatory domain-containing protein n=1 Tax=Mycena citricolor TaxID=2018698 RepID=A0AAD2K8L4_9AGAR|nr:unnamed protein product [Mycena citricolor]